MANEVYSVDCRAMALSQQSNKPAGFAICKTNKESRRFCKFAHDFGHDVVACNHPLYEEIVARTIATDKTAST